MSELWENFKFNSARNKSLKLLTVKFIFQKKHLAGVKHFP